jgi:hypothetical protein
MHTLIAGRYEVLEALTSSAAGTIYKVRHPVLDAVLVVTVLPEGLTADAGRLAQVRRAARAAMQLRHDHIVPVLDFAEDAGRYHLIEAFADARRLDVREHGPVPPVDALHIARQLASALAHAHERGVVHGAIAPACVLVEPGTPPRALLSGFVLASGVLTPAPEPGSSTDVRDDVRALGLLLYEMLEGRPFFSGTAEEIEALRDGSTPLLPTFSRIVPSGVSALVARAIRPSPAQRQQSMTQLRHEIDRCLGRIVEQNGGGDDRMVRAVAQAAPSPRAPRRRATGAETDATAVERKVVRVAFPAEVDDPAEPGPAQSEVARRILGSHGVRVGPRRAPTGSLLLAAAVLVVGGWLALRPARSASTATVRAEAPAVAPAVAVAELADASPPSVQVVAVEAPRDAVPTEPAPPEERGGLVGPQPARTAPRIVSALPDDRVLGVLEGALVDFGVRATNGDTGDRLAHAWFLDGQRVGRRSRWRFRAPYGAAGTTHTVEVEVADGAGVKTPRVAWSLEVIPRMSEANVVDWLGRLAAAVERKDIATLRLYGLVTDDAEGEALRKRVSRHKAARVSVGNEAIETDGRYARVSFDLAELDERGELLGTHREAYELEKQSTGFIALRRR